MTTRSERGRAYRAGALAARSVLACSLLVPTAGVAQAGALPALRLDGVAALVGAAAPGPTADVVLRSDVELRARLSLLGKVEDPTALSPLRQSLLRATLAEMVGELLIAREARRLSAATPGPTEIERERMRLVLTAGGQSRLRALMLALSADEDELVAIARRRALVASFLSATLEGVTDVTEAALDQALAEDPVLATGQTREQARVELRARLSRQALDRTIARWVAVLRARTEVHLYAEY